MPPLSKDPDADRSDGVPIGVLLVSWFLGFVVALAVVLWADVAFGPLWVAIPAATALTTAAWWRRTHHPPLKVAAAQRQQQGFWPSKDPGDYRGRGPASPPVPALPFVVGMSGGPLLSWASTTGDYSPLTLAAGVALMTVVSGAATVLWRVRRS